MMLLCEKNFLREVSSPGKAGRTIALSNNEQMLIKILKKSEVKVLLDVLPKYYFHRTKNPASVITTLYGLHSVRQVGGLKVYFVVCSKHIPKYVSVHNVFHLKGSSKGRKTHKLVVEEHVLHKDSDFNYCFYLKPSIRAKLLAQINLDCEFLLAEGVIEYSLLLGVSMQTTSPGSVDSQSSCRNTGYSSSIDSVDSNYSNSDTSSSCSSQEFDDTQLISFNNCGLPNCGECKLGVGTPARAVQKKMAENENGKNPKSFKVVLYFAIVDFNRRYTMKKGFKHLYKSLQYDSKHISAVNTKEYTSCFLNYIERIFLAENSDSSL
ncbi:putative phosphatidylinositol 4-phosphate 5-kinase 11 isoform X2 [Manihot esculenta]|nr:putative phosphatidylinositol 4-phosphate 5-kinase 11 isoform X2 [Manihot esculenta]OAY51185.1 hypothetical protein MANES_05G194800v8 [Manihot esculenta]